jgi:hypothetical protein
VVKTTEEDINDRSTLISSRKPPPVSKPSSRCCSVFLRLSRRGCLRPKRSGGDSIIIAGQSKWSSHVEIFENLQTETRHQLRRIRILRSHTTCSPLWVLSETSWPRVCVCAICSATFCCFLAQVLVLRYGEMPVSRSNSVCSPRSWPEWTSISWAKPVFDLFWIR